MKEIPSEVMTAILPDLPLSYGNEFLSIGFQNRRKANKSTLYNKIYSSIPRNDDYSPKASPEYITLKNTGFTLELEEIEDLDHLPRVIIGHPDLPERTYYKFGFSLNKDNWWEVISLIALSGGMIRRKLVGTFYYDPESKFFVLENDPVGEMKDSKDLGSKLSGKWTKVVPGHEYYLELGPGRLEVMRAVYLGLIPSIPLYNHHYYGRTYLTMYPRDFKFIRDDYYYGTIHRGDAMLFRKIEPEETYFLTTKPNLRGIDLGDRGETMDLLGYQDLCLENSWVIGMDLKNKDIFKKYIIEPLIEFIKSRSGRLDDYRFTGDYSNSIIDLRVYSSGSLYSKITEKIGTSTPGPIAARDMTGLCSMFNKDFVDLSEEEIKDALHEIFMGCFGRD